jgi:hypothetical protein
MQLIDGAFWGFRPVDGFDIENTIESIGVEKYQYAKIFQVDDTPYTEDLYVSNQTYKVEKQCPFDDRIFPDYILNIGYFYDDFDSNAIHRSKHIYCGGVIDLCGGNNLCGIVPTHFAFIISEELKDNIIRNEFRGFSFYDIIVCPNQTSIKNIRLFGVNTNEFPFRPYHQQNVFENISPCCPVCDYQPLFCSNCERYFAKCPRCNTKLYNIVNEWGRNATVIAGESWNGNDIFIPYLTDIADYIVTKRVMDFIERNQYGPIIALPFQVDVSRCTDEQKSQIYSLLK